MTRWNKHGRHVRRQAGELRDELGDAGELGGNGATRGGGYMRLIHRGRRRRRRSRRLLIALLLLTAAGAMGARHCRTYEDKTDAQRARLRADVIEGCRINNCTRDELAALLNQVDAFPRAEEDVQR